MLEKLQEIKEKWNQLGLQLQEEEVMNDFKKYNEVNKEYKALEKIVGVIQNYEDVLSNIDHSKEVLNNEKDEEFRDMAKTELDELNRKQEELEQEIKVLLIPKDREDEKNAIIEIRGGAGGDEASIFAGDLFKMYARYCEQNNYKVEIVSQALGTIGGYKEIIFNVTGASAFGKFKYEAGVHRVQRVPATETQGRVHTSAASVAVLPEAEEFDVELNDSDIKKDTFRASGAGGQHVNKTESAIRLTHIPSGSVVECQDQRSQLKNYAQALKTLRTRLYDMEYQKHMAEIAKKRKTMVSTGDRSAKIRTYNFPQGRLTDHRIGLTLYNLPEIMAGDITEIMDALAIAENAERMKTSGN